MVQFQSYRRKVFLLISITILIKCVAAILLELGNDEVYYWTYALQLDWNNFDHPPIIGLLIRLTTLNLWWASELSLRLGGILGAAISTWFIFKLGKLIDSERAGWFAALIYTACIYTGFIAGLFILPDSPQMPFWTAALYIMAHLILKKDDQKNVFVWALLGIIIGLATLCKVHGLYLWAGFGLFILFKRFDWLTNWRIYFAVLITVCFTIPIFYWNFKNDFITYKFHSERVSNTGIQLESLLREIGGEIVYQNPILIVLYIVSVIALFSKKIRFKQKRIVIWLFCMSVPMLLIFWSISLFNPTLPHWSGPAYIPVFLIAAVYLEQSTIKVFPNWLKISLGFIVVVLFSGIAIIRYSPRNFGSQDLQIYGEYCPTLDLSGWKDFGIQFNNIVKQDIETKVMKKGLVIIANQWFPAGHIEFYVSKPSGIPLIGVGSLKDLHKFIWLNKDRKKLVIGDDAYCIVPSNLPLDVQFTYGNYFTKIKPAQTINQVRNGGVVRFFYIYRLIGCKKIPDDILKN
jgi:4-amino-4-deoxy-L-arabinose transferase-like glycosyltransferase